MAVPKSAVVATATTAARLPNRPCQEVILRNDDASITVLVGGADAQDFEVLAGLTVGPIKVANQNQIYVKSASGTPSVQILSF